MRSWWSEYGAYVVGGVVLGAAILFGFNYYQSSQVQAEVAASLLYDNLTEQVVGGEAHLGASKAKRTAEPAKVEPADSSDEGSVRISIVAESESRRSTSHHDLPINTLDSGAELAPPDLGEPAQRIAVLVEDLVSGAWGATVVDLN